MNPPEIGKTVTDDLAKPVATSDFSALRRNCRIAKSILQDQLHPSGLVMALRNIPPAACAAETIEHPALPLRFRRL